MHKTNLRKVGGSVMLAVPPVMLELLHLDADASVGISIDNGRLIIEPASGPRYSLAELLAKCDASCEPSQQDREWLNSRPVGSELL